MGGDMECMEDTRLVEEGSCSSKAHEEGMVKEVVETYNSKAQEVKEMEEEEICSSMVLELETSQVGEETYNSMVVVVRVMVVVGTYSSKGVEGLGFRV